MFYVVAVPVLLFLGIVTLLRRFSLAMLLFILVVIAIRILLLPFTMVGWLVYNQSKVNIYRESL